MAAEKSRPFTPVAAPRFPTYHTASDLPPQARIICEILATTPVHEVEARLAAAQIQLTPEIIPRVLKLSYNNPSTAAKFFRWSGLALQHTGYSWNLMVDLLGKNQLFEPMWEAIHSMKKEGLLSLTTFVSVFENYCVTGRFDEAVMTFEVMEGYDVQPDTVAVNSLLSAMCREENQTVKALEFFERIKAKIPPDADSFAILLEGWEKEGNVAKAKCTFEEMVICVGWSPQYMFAYDAFLNTLVRGSNADEAIKFLHIMKGKKCLPGLRFFSNALDIFVKQNDLAHAVAMWDVMTGGGVLPNLMIYNTMIGLLTRNNDIDGAFRLLDSMAYDGAFPDSLTYNMIFECLIRNKKVREVVMFYNEMIKNEWPPTPQNFTDAIKMMFSGDDPEMAVEMWKYMSKNNISPRDDSANAVLLGLCNLVRLTDLRRFAEKMIDEGIIICESTMTKVRNAFLKEGRSGRETYDHISSKWKSAYLKT
ncbi:pentatricopeptide repeat-containing protein At1g77360, mitochondrial-like [Andrographis paniculata]|uniref:pentatricopeptide repeat-containing protein At1g77360, mitochondrial-like n=1 Tax=Andrographis paniculata TaxID=175694 RepID=UPI0021E77AC6|nr:pentatricopeptide repeat-containing protein At1g77360, mitochondrial-like [Andrographis paniculata]